jgi:4-hydroxyphenylacetate 3-monooxygenase
LPAQGSDFTSKLSFKVNGRAESLALDKYTLIIAGFTGSNREGVEKHLQELREQGIEVPDRVPTFYPIPSGLASQSATIKVKGKKTSGEIEPVLLISNGSYYITLGSDHTDREIEKKSIAESKASCPKPISSAAYPLEEAVRFWDHISIGSDTYQNGAWKSYQKGMVTDLIQPLKLAALLQKDRGSVPENLVMFLGTVPILDGKFVFSDGFRGSMIHNDSKFSLDLEYKVEVEDQ